jgi:hypothetical protein
VQPGTTRRRAVRADDGHFWTSAVGWAKYTVIIMDSVSKGLRRSHEMAAFLEAVWLCSTFPSPTSMPKLVVG